MVGSASRIPTIVRKIQEVFGQEIKRTMNASEAVCRGCALQCAMLSPVFRVREFEVIDSFPFSVAFEYPSPDTREIQSQVWH